MTKTTAQRKKSIYINGALEKIYDECSNALRNRTFSGRVMDIAERYDALMGLTEIPELTPQQQMILGEAVLGAFMDRNKIRYLHDAIADTEIDGCLDLAKMVRDLDYAQRLKLIESINI
ncbi:TPA: hypothetical protein ACQNWS_001648 [Streptococcus pyogenes]|uniref:Phage protein n=2 Tax=Streptococcus pyogenes TaxID=1314 RepID=A0A5S4TK77_STRPY|nr:hypothetical protein [Streptococcus pyogenes]NP_795424.1 hypothetical protein SpyM3_0732 [Streptococcus phage 315.1]QBX20085.1 hypothetical protein Javan507_0054 [Streptococcus phage Javan507]UNI71089.1 hypothetical protein [Streptococcus phage phiAp1.1-Spec]HEP6174466.1 hypothetical protein [Streptococcus pyogenes ABC020026425]HEP6177988.1 hypothetical protein [Streptococcus pyogenes ABC020015306]HEP6194040.1 hypothetical protein [Streptococcus pyogenes ABC020035469]HEP6209010.1 hypothet